MNKFILLIILLFTVISGQSQTTPEPPDTIKVINNPEKVVVTSYGETTMIEVESVTDLERDRFTYEVTVHESDTQDSDSEIEFEIPFGIRGRKEGRQGYSDRRRLRTSTFVFGNVYVGQRFNYANKGNVKNSVEFGVRNLIGLRWSHGPYTPCFSIGVGLGWQKYKAQDGFIYSMDGSRLLLVPILEGCDVIHSEMNVFNFQIPLIFTIPIGCDVDFQAGAIGCFNTYAKALTDLETEHVKYKTTYKRMQQRLFTVELTATLGVCDILGVYASWSPMTLFQAPYGPQLKSWSIGGTLNF